MLVTFPDRLTVTENYNLGRYGEVLLSAGGRLYEPTQIASPGATALAQQDLNKRDSILLDDGSTREDPDPIVYPAPGLSADHTLRSGDSVDDLTGVVYYGFGAYSIQPVGTVNFVATNPRPNTPPAVGGTLKVAGFNLLNYFTTMDNGQPICGRALVGRGGLDCRGANSAEEFQRQRAKIIDALTALNADVVGLMELENNMSASIQDLVAGLNDALGARTYAFIDTGTIGADAIKVGMIYKPATVTPSGAYKILDSTVAPSFIDTKNRPVLAQTFVEKSSGVAFTVAANHLKSKGSDCLDINDPDTNDGQGNCNQTRTKAAQALATWLASDPTGSGSTYFIIVGDINAYLNEDPITSLKRAGYADLIEHFAGSNSYSYVFQGQSGSLDHVLTSDSLTPLVTGAVNWHINADEPHVLDYNEEYKKPDQITSLYSSEAARSSDHDPLLVGLCLDTTPPQLTVTATPDTLWSSNDQYATVTTTLTSDDPHAAISLVSVTDRELSMDNNKDHQSDDIVIVNDRTFKLRAKWSDAPVGRIYTITYAAVDTCGNRSIASTNVVLPSNQESIRVKESKDRNGVYASSLGGSFSAKRINLPAIIP